MAALFLQRAYSATDVSSYSNPGDVRARHVDIDWTIDFSSQVISGSCTHILDILIDGADTVVFDSRNLTIARVAVNGQEVVAEIGERHAVLGSKVTVPIPAPLRKQGTAISVRFDYSQSPQASAVQWLDQEQTKGGQHPYVFTQCCAIHARSLLPVQDTPGVKITYTAKVSAPAWCTVLMSALMDADGVFRQNQPISPYLLALAAGRLDSRDVSERVRIWAEPEVIEDASYEFSDTERFLEIAEQLAGPYVWGRYDVLCLPPSFPYGGAENPCLTFATPTLLAGDKSLANVIAHEIAHSWTGNLVTNATWEHFWLNEGWTMWLERKIMSRMHGHDFFKLSAQVGWKMLENSVRALGEDSPFTQLVWPLEDGGDLDEAFSSVPYEKGFHLLYSLELLVGEQAFEEFARSYLTAFQPGIVTSGQFRDFFVSQFAHLPEVCEIDWDARLFCRGMPSPCHDFSNKVSADTEALAAVWIDHATAGSLPNQSKALEMHGWKSLQVCVFLEVLLRHCEAEETEMLLSDELLHALDAVYGFGQCRNAEITFRWQSLCLLCEARWIVPEVIAFVTGQGRMKYVRPLYRALCELDKDTAQACFMTNAGRYHPIARKLLTADVGLDKANSST